MATIGDSSQKEQRRSKLFQGVSAELRSVSAVFARTRTQARASGTASSCRRWRAKGSSRGCSRRRTTTRRPLARAGGDHASPPARERRLALAAEAPARREHAVGDRGAGRSCCTARRTARVAQASPWLRRARAGCDPADTPSGCPGRRRRTCSSGRDARRRRHPRRQYGDRPVQRARDRADRRRRT